MVSDCVGLWLCRWFLSLSVGGGSGGGSTSAWCIGGVEVGVV